MKKYLLLSILSLVFTTACSSNKGGETAGSVAGPTPRSSPTPSPSPIPIPGPNYEVSKYGAKPDGITDNCQAIQQAVNDAQIAGGGVIKFNQNGTYLLATSNCVRVTTSGIVFQGPNGWGWRSGNPGAKLLYNVKTGAAFTVSGSETNMLSGILFERLSFAGPGGMNSENKSIGIYFEHHVAGHVVQEIQMTDFNVAIQQGYGGSPFFDDGRIRNGWFGRNNIDYWLAGGCCTEISDSLFDGPSYTHILSTSELGDIRADNNAFFNSMAGHVIASDGFDYVFTRNVFEDSTDKQGPFMTFSGNAREIRIENNWFGGGVPDAIPTQSILLKGNVYGVQIIGNRISDVGGTAITVSENANNVIISSNYIRGGGLFSGQSGILVNSISGFPAYVNILGNQFKDFPGTINCINTSSNPSNILVTGNQGSCKNYFGKNTQVGTNQF